MPSEQDSLEGGWAWEDGRSSLSSTVYAIDDDVLVMQPVNVAKSQSGGLDLVAAGHIVVRLNATLSCNAYYEIDAGNRMARHGRAG